MRLQNKCSSCGLLTKHARGCSACKVVYYCGKNCQKMHWKRHKHYCGKNDSNPDHQPRPSSDIVISKVTTDKDANICNICKSNNNASGGNPAMCFSCGIFVCCGPCFGRPEMSGINGEPAVPFLVCEACLEADSKAKSSIIDQPGKLLRKLLDKKSTGRHVNHGRLALAQLMLNDKAPEHVTGIQKDIESAKEEYLWLANDCDYAPAQLALANFLDPSCHRNNMFWPGPILCDNKLMPVPNPPFQPDKNLAIKFYNRACAQNNLMALAEVGTMYKNGRGIFPQDIAQAKRMFRIAAGLGDVKAMTNLGGQFLSEGNIKEAAQLFERAAKYGNYQGMMITAQLALQNPSMKSKGREYIQILVDAGYIPPVEGGDVRMMMLCQAYDIK